MQGIYKSNINSDSWNFFANKKSRGVGKARQISEKQEITTFIREIPPTKNTLCLRNAPHPPTVPTVRAGNTPGPRKGKTPSRPAFRCPAARYPCPYGNVPRTPTRQLRHPSVARRRTGKRGAGTETTHGIRPVPGARLPRAMRRQPEDSPAAAGRPAPAAEKRFSTGILTRLC